MALFDALIRETSEKFDLSSDQSRALLAAVLETAKDPKTGGLNGFQNRFRAASDAPHSLNTPAATETFSKERIESALGAETIAALADRADLDYAATVSALTFVVPQTISLLTSSPSGEALDEQTLLAEIEGFSGARAEAPDATAAKTVSTEAFDRIGNAAENVGVKEFDSVNRAGINDFAAAGDKFSAAPLDYRSDADVAGDEFNDDSPLKWLAPLIILVLLVALGFWFCGNASAPPA